MAMSKSLEESREGPTRFWLEEAELNHLYGYEMLMTPEMIEEEKRIGFIIGDKE